MIFFIEDGIWRGNETKWSVI